jgi:Uma2 family endonuclease
MATVPAMFTYEDLQKMPDDGRRYELIGGEIVVSPSPSRAHQQLVLRLVIQLQAFVEAHRLGEVILAPFDVRFSPHDVVEPDVLFVSRERLAILGNTYVDGAPDLVIEILSPSTRGRDEGEKLSLYAASGVREYWLVDPANKSFRALAIDADRYRLIPPAGSVVGSRVLPGLEIDAEALFADLP